MPTAVGGFQVCRAALRECVRPTARALCSVSRPPTRPHDITDSPTGWPQALFGPTHRRACCPSIHVVCAHPNVVLVVMGSTKHSVRAAGDGDTWTGMQRALTHHPPVPPVALMAASKHVMACATSPSVAGVATQVSRFGHAVVGSSGLHFHAGQCVAGE